MHRGDMYGRASGSGIATMWSLPHSCLRTEFVLSQSNREKAGCPKDRSSSRKSKVTTAMIIVLNNDHWGSY